MAKLTKRQLNAHNQACEILQQPELSFDDKWYVFENWHEGAEKDVTASSAFFTPLDLARDFSIDVCGERVIDLCAGIGALSFALYHCGYGRYGTTPKITCVEINPRYVEIGKKLLPEATWICADAFDVYDQLGSFDTAMSNPPFGRMTGAGRKGPAYTGAEFEFKIIDIASQIAEFGTFLLPQMSAGFRYSGARFYERQDNTKYARFTRDTGLHLDAGAGVDTSIFREDWKFKVPALEIACTEFPQRIPASQAPAEQLSLFAAAA